MINVCFSRLRETDFALVYRWRISDHVKQWWDAKDLTYEAIVAKYRPRITGQIPVDCYIIQLQQNAIGFIQAYRLQDYPHYLRYLPIHTADSRNDSVVGVDLYIGEREYLYQGLGSKILRQFMQDIVFTQMNAPCCIIDPHPDNTIAIRAYEKAGFVPVAIVPSEDEHPVYLMQIDHRRLRNC